MFAIGDLVVYGGEGVCRVTEIGVPAISGADKKREYYTLAPLYRTGQVMTPVDTCVLMRPVMTCAEAKDLLSELPSLEPEAPPQPGMRATRDHYHAVCTSYDCRKMARLIKYTARRRKWALSHGKKVSQLDERFSKRAQDQFYGELAAALDIPRDRVPERIQEDYPSWPEE